MLEIPAGQFMLQYGTHDGTLSGRESADPTIHATLEEASAAFDEARSRFGEGVKIWFAYVLDDQRKIVKKLAPDEPYSRG